MDAYFQDKISQVLRSEVFCQARSSCLNREPGLRSSREEIRRELFPASTRGEQRSRDMINNPGRRENRRIYNNRRGDP